MSYTISCLEWQLSQLSITARQHATGSITIATKLPQVIMPLYLLVTVDVL